MEADTFDRILVLNVPILLSSSSSEHNLPIDVEVVIVGSIDHAIEIAQLVMSGASVGRRVFYDPARFLDPALADKFLIV